MERDKATATTGEIIPRDYGLVITSPRRKKLLLSPSKYAVGTLILETPQHIRARIEERAARVGADPEELAEEFAAGVQKREGSKNVLRVGGRNALQGVEKYPRTYSARVKSKSRYSPAFYQVHIDTPWRAQGLEHRVVRCDCKDNSWTEVKELDVLCPHAAALEIALTIDNTTRTSASNNLTGLYPCKRREAPTIPFALFGGENDEERLRGQQAITDILFDYYLAGKNHFEINLALLAQNNLYAPALRALLREGSDRVSFGVVRQEAKQEGNQNGGGSAHRLHGAIRALESRISGELRSRGFRRSGYGIEFKGTSYQVVAQRFVQGNTAYSLCIKEGMLPLLVKKNLGARVDSPALEMRTDSPLQRTGHYLSVDDTTRRECYTQIVLPGMREDSLTSLPAAMKKAYERALADAATVPA